MNNTSPKDTFNSHESYKRGLEKKVGNPNDNLEVKEQFYKAQSNLRHLRQIEYELEERTSRNPFKIALEIIKDRKRIANSGAEDKIIGLHKTSALEKAKRRTIPEITNYLKTICVDIEKNEYGLAFHNLTHKYKVQNMRELLDLGNSIELDDVKKIIDLVKNAIEFRKKKIIEYLCYRYARSEVTTLGIEDFVKNVANLVHSSRDQEYRSRQVKPGGEIEAVSYDDVQDFMRELSDDLENKSYTDTKQIQIEALKIHLIFEWIHPFLDGNGRIGRALFVFLQRKLGFVAKGSVMHIPIARRESGTDALNGSRYISNPGSVALIINLVEKNIYSILRQHENKRLNYSKIRSIIDSEALKEPIEQLYGIIKDEHKRDKANDKDWQPIIAAAKETIADSKN